MGKSFLGKYLKAHELINNDNNIIKFTLFGRGKVAWKDTVAIVLLYKTRLKQSNGTHTLVIGRTKSGKKVEAKFVQHFPPNRQNFRSEVSHRTLVLYIRFHPT